MTELEKVESAIGDWHRRHDAHMFPGMPAAYIKARRRALNIQLDRLCERRDALRQSEGEGRACGAHMQLG
jgi:hypothetical protein